MALAAIWGTSFLFIKMALEALAPLHVSFGRMAFGSLALVPVVVVRRDRLPRDPPVWGHLAVAALLLNAAPFSLFAYGETRVPSVLAGIWNATTPLLVLAVAVVRHPSFARLYASCFLLSPALFTPLVFLAPYAEDHRATKVAAAALVGVVGAASTLGRLGLGPVADRLGRLPTCTACFAVMGASHALWLLVGSYRGLVAFAVVLGVAYGGFIALYPAVVADVFGTAAMGTAVGALYPVSASAHWPGRRPQLARSTPRVATPGRWALPWPAGWRPPSSFGASGARSPRQQARTGRSPARNAPSVRGTSRPAGGGPAGCGAAATRPADGGAVFGDLLRGSRPGALPVKTAGGGGTGRRPRADRRRGRRWPRR